jgi:hypothetical protein
MNPVEDPFHRGVLSLLVSLKVWVLARDPVLLLPVLAGLEDLVEGV